MATKKQEPSAEKVYDEIIVSLSQELTDLETKVRQIEARMRPLDRAIIDLKDVEDFITDREMDTEGASELFETIMSNMLKDINLGQTFAGETPIAGRLPRNVMDEMQVCQPSAIACTDALSIPRGRCYLARCRAATTVANCSRTSLWRLKMATNSGIERN